MNCRIILLFFIVFAFACAGNVQDPDEKDRSGELSAEESFVKINRYLIKRNEDFISSYIKTMGWEMQRTETGLWYSILQQGKGNKTALENIITLNYTISLPDGTICDTSEGKPPKSFRIGHGGVEAGLEEGVLLLNEGDKARFIMPPHLAHGNFGDRNKIPPGAILIYEVEVINIR